MMNGLHAMRKNIITENVAQAKSKKQAIDLVHTLQELEQSLKALRTEKQERKTAEAKLAKFQRLFDLMARNFPGGKICILNQGAGKKDPDATGQLTLSQLPVTNGQVTDNSILLFDADTLSKLRQAFNGDTVFCEVKSNEKFYHVTAVPLSDGEHAIQEILCVIQDFTQRKSMEEGLVKALEKERELGELKSRFVTMASHEFRTPLTMILSSTFLIENAAAENYETEKRTHTNRIKRAVNNLTLILNEFLSLEKLEQNKIEVVTADVNIPEFIQDTLTEMEILKREMQVLRYFHAGDQDIARIDHHLLWSIITNLASNALKYSKSGDVIEITSEIREKAIQLTVRDSGIGIPDDEQKFIFGRFFRARNATNIEGTGLGLHIIQKYIHLLNGTIAFESKLDVGTTFRVLLPIDLTNTEGEHLKSKT
jgi:signal transduction histidine kinase